MKIHSTKSLAPALACIGPLAVYLGSMAPDLGTIDSGELAAVCTRLQVAHPTGYPLYTLLGWLATRILPATTPIARLNLLSAFLTALSCLWIFLLFRAIAVRVRPGIRTASADLLALGGAWLWAVHPALWSQALGNEVHALQAALATALLWSASTAANPRRRLLTAYLLGLALANHMTVLYLVPGLLAGGLIAGGLRELRGPGRISRAAALFLVGLTPYLYLPLRSLADPLLDWGDPTNVQRLFRHVAASQYRVWLFASQEGFSENLLTFLRELTTPWSLPVLGAASIGIVGMAKRDRPGLARLGFGLLVGTFWASGYEIHDLEPYFLIPRLCLAGLAVAGIAFLLPSATRHAKDGLLVATALLAAVTLTALRWSDQTRQNDRFVRLYATSLLETLPARTILLTRHWDLVVSPLLYLQQVEGMRPDVSVVDVELFRRSWYFPQLRRTYPGLLEPIEEEVAAFLEQLDLFEGRRPYDPKQIEERYRAVITGIFEAHRSSRPVFHTPEVEQAFYGGWFGIPEAMAVRMVGDPKEAPAAAPLDPEPWSAQARHVNEEVRRIAWMLPIDLARARVRLLRQLGRRQEAARWQMALDRFSEIEILE